MSPEASTASPQWVALEGMGMPRVLFQRLRDRATGILNLANATKRLNIVIDQGIPVFAGSSAPEDSLASILLERRVLDRQKLQDVLAAAKAQGLQLGTVLVQRGLVDSNALAELVREQMRAVVLQAFTWEAGHWLFQAQALGSRESVTLARHPLELILLGMETNFSAERARREGFPPQQPEHLLIRSGPGFPQNLDSVAVPSSEMTKILEVAGKAAPWPQIVQNSGLQPDQALRAGYALWVLDALVAQGPAAAGSSAGDDGPEILGDVGQLQQQYEKRRQATIQAEKPPEPKPLPQRSPKPQASPSPKSTEPAQTDPGEVTLEPKKASAPAQKGTPAIAKPAASPTPQTAPVAPVKTTAPSAVVAEVRRSGSAPLDSAPLVSAMVWAKALGWIVLGAMLLGVGAAGWLYLDLTQGQALLDRLRLFRMYGQPTLDAKRLGQFYEDDGQLRKARDSFRQALSRTPNDDRLEFALARLHQRLDEWSEAKARYVSILARNPAFVDAHQGLAWRYLHEGEVALAKKEFYLYLASSPVTPQTEMIRRLVQGMP